MTAWRGGAPGAMAVAEALATVLHNRLATGAGRVRVEAFANLWTGELDRRGVALWSIGLGMPVPLDPDEAAAELDGFLRAGLDLDLPGDGGDIDASGISTLPQRQRERSQVMPISFDSIPANARVPFMFVEIDSSRAGAGGVDFKSLLIGQRLSTGAVEPGVPTPIAIASSVVGATDPDLDDALAAIGDEQYNVIAVPWTAAGEIAKLEAELAERWGPTQQIDGVGIAAWKGAGGTQAQATTYGNARNSPHVSVMDAGGSPTPAWAWAAAIAGAVSASAAGDRAGTVRIERLVTTYQTTASGVPDTAFLDLNTPLTLSHLRADFRNTILRKYPRHKLADDGTRIGPGQAVITPGVGRAEAIALFRRWEESGLVEGADQFKTDLVVERDAQDRNRLNWLMAPDVVNQFRVGGAKLAFLL